MKHYKLFNKGDKVQITSTHKDDLGKIGIIQEVRPSFCKILIIKENGEPELNWQNNKPIIYNHTYAQFKKINNINELDNGKVFREDQRTAE